MGDGVAALEIHTRRNLCDEAVVDLVARVPDRIKEGFRALVIGSDDPHAFSAGATLDVFIDGAEHGAWDRVSNFLRQGQEALLGLRYAGFPVVAAVHGLTRGGGCELMLHADAVVAHTDLRIGFPERWIGAVPGWGGVTQMLRRWQRRSTSAIAASRVFDVIARAQTLSIGDAIAAGLIDEDDPVVAERPALLAFAKRRAVELAKAYMPPPPSSIEAVGAEYSPRLEEALAELQAVGSFSHADVVAARELIGIICGGSCGAGARLSESQVMRLEHDAFMRLLRHPETLTRMHHIRSTGLPLRG
jgi:3-hydroxyacyl-CoA dehydrogenase